MAYAKQRTRLEALELQNRRAMYACEQAAVKDIEARFAGLQRNLKAQLAATYIHCFGAEPSEFQKSKMTGFEYHWRAASGRVIAQFVAVEAKTPAYDKCTEEQRNFLQAVVRAGGAAFIARRRGTELELEEIKAEEAPCTAR